MQHAVFADRRLRLRYRHSGTPAPVEYTVDPYGLVSKASVWYLVADLRGEPRLFRADRVVTAEAAEEPVRRRPGVGLGEAWAVLREQVERPPKEVLVKVRVRRGRMDIFVRIHGARLTSPPPPDAGTGTSEEWVELALGFQALPSVRALLSFGADAEVLSPPAARRELARAAAEAARLYRD